MPSKSRRGFASMSKKRHQEISARGGSAKVPKGMSTLSPERRVEIARKGVEIRKNTIKEEDI